MTKLLFIVPLFFFCGDSFKAQSAIDYSVEYNHETDSVFSKEGRAVLIRDLPKENISLTLVRGKVMTDDGSIPPKTQIRIYSLDSSEELKYVYNPDPTNGTYLFILPPGQNYTMMVESDGYETYTKVIQVPSQTQYYQLQQTVYLHKDKTLQKTIGIEDHFIKADVKNLDSTSKEDVLVQFIEKMITSSDTHTLKHLDQYLQNELHGDTKYFSSLSQIIEKIIENSDFTMLQNLEKISRDAEHAEADLVLYFSSNNAELTNEHINLLNAYMKTLPTYAVLDISGHSDFIGSSLSKYLIASLRSKSVSDFIDIHYPDFSDQYTVNIKSDSEPLKEQSLEKNRRVEIRVLK